MKNKNISTAILITALLVISCRFSSPDAGSERPTGDSTLPAATPTIPSSTSEPQTQPLQFSTGRNDYTIEVDGTSREFIVYVPSEYDLNRPTPVVFMIHGSNQSGEVMYEGTDWVEKAEQENFIVVYPTSWKYKLTTSNRVEDKWNVHNLHTVVAPDTELKDDVKFIRTIFESLQITFNLDLTRIYASGFSNGGAFVISRLILEMNDVFAAYSTAGAAIFGPATPANIEADLSQVTQVSVPASLYIIMGSNDEKLAEFTGATLPFPVVAEEMLQHPNLGDIFTKTPQLLSLSSTYKEQYEKPAFTIMTFSDSPTNAGNQFIFRMVKNMGHVYPSHDNNRYALNATDLFWDFFLQYHK